MNWVCPYCGGQNSDHRKKCVTCNSALGEWDLGRAKRKIGNVVPSGAMVVFLYTCVLLLGDRFLDSYQKGLRLGSIILTVVLTIGVLRRSRTCAFLLPMLRVLGVIVEWHLTGKAFSALGFFAIDGLFLLEAIRGTFAYHRIMERNRSTCLLETPSYSSSSVQCSCDPESTWQEDVSYQTDEPQPRRTSPESESEPDPICELEDKLSQWLNWWPMVSRLKIPIPCQKMLLRIQNFMDEL